MVSHRLTGMCCSPMHRILSEAGDLIPSPGPGLQVVTLKETSQHWSPHVRLGWWPLRAALTSTRSSSCCALHLWSWKRRWTRISSLFIRPAGPCKPLSKENSIYCLSLTTKHPPSPWPFLLNSVLGQGYDNAVHTGYYQRGDSSQNPGSEVLAVEIQSDG